MSKEKKPNTRTEAEKMADWRKGRKPLDTPKGKYKWGTRSSSKKGDAGDKQATTARD